MEINFENREVNKAYTFQMAIADFRAMEGAPKENFPGTRTMIRQKNGNKYLEVRYPKGIFAQGTKLRHYFSTPSEWARTCFKVYVPNNFDFVNGGKLNGLAGAASDAPSGGNFRQFGGFSVRAMWEAKGEIVAYVYHPFQKQQYGDKYLLRKKLRKSRWNNMCIEVSVNTPGKDDGWVRFTLNGHSKKFKKFEFRRNKRYAVDLFMFSTFFGGGGPSYAPTKDQFLYFDDFVIEGGDAPNARSALPGIPK